MLGLVILTVRYELHNSPRRLLYRRIMLTVPPVREYNILYFERKLSPLQVSNRIVAMKVGSFRTDPWGLTVCDPSLGPHTPGAKGDNLADGVFHTPLEHSPNHPVL